MVPLVTQDVSADEPAMRDWTARERAADGAASSTVRADVPPASGRTPAPSSPAVRAVMRANGPDSSVERALRSELHRRGLRFRKHLAPLPGTRCRPDVVFTRARVAVFVDGCFWHRCPEHFRPPRRNDAWWSAKLDRNVERDRAHDAALVAAGWTVLRAWEHEPVEAVADRICRTVAAGADRPPV